MPRHIIHQPRILGENLKQLRRSRDLTTEHLAMSAGISKAYLSLIESGQRSPHWSIIMRIVHSAGYTLCRFLTEAERVPPAEDNVHSRGAQRIVIEGDPPNAKGRMDSPPTRNYTHILTPWRKDMVSQTIEIYLEPHTEWTPQPIGFSGRVACWGVQGRLLLVIGKTEYVMNESDALDYDSMQPHEIRNYTDQPLKALLVVVGDGL